MRPEKTQISLGIRQIWLESSLSAWRKLGSLATHWAHSEDSDQPWRWAHSHFVALSWGSSNSLITSLVKMGKESWSMKASYVCSELTNHWSFKAFDLRSMNVRRIHNVIRIVTKPTKWHVRPAKTQISLGIRPVWSGSSLCVQWVAKDTWFLHVDSEDSDQTGWMPRLIWVFTGRTVTLFVLFYRGSFYEELLSRASTWNNSNQK